VSFFNNLICLTLPNSTSNKSTRFKTRSSHHERQTQTRDSIHNQVS